MAVVREATAQTLRSILCGKGCWTVDQSGHCRLAFHENGRGEMHCGAELSTWVYAETTWSVSPPEILDQTLSMSSDGQLVECELQITLEKNEPPSIGDVKLGVNEKTLAPEAFSSARTFTIRLFKGQFLAWHNLLWLQVMKEEGLVENAEEEAEELARINAESFKYSLQLVFDKSPWPLRENWIGNKVPQDMFHFWDEVNFVNLEWRSFED